MNTQQETSLVLGQDVSVIVDPLLRWYESNARILPWRENPTPYRVLVSEIMLQQTRVEAVKPYFDRFMKQLPNIQALAEAPEDVLLKLWEGLGYYNRVRNLNKAACIVMQRHHGELPASYEELLALPGVGEYTAGAVASIAFQIPVPAVDGNVLRVMARLCASSQNIDLPQTKREVRAGMQQIMPQHRAGDFNQALMELGATVCLPNGEPNCEKCPLRFACRAYQNGNQHDYPVKSSKRERKIVRKTVFVIHMHGKYALQKREQRGLLAGMWEFPFAGGFLTESEAKEWLQTAGIDVGEITALPSAKHLFTHIEWQMIGYDVQADHCSLMQWVSWEEGQRDYALPSAYAAYFPQL